MVFLLEPCIALEAAQDCTFRGPCALLATVTGIEPFLLSLSQTTGVTFNGYQVICCWSGGLLL